MALGAWQGCAGISGWLLRQTRPRAHVGMPVSLGASTRSVGRKGSTQGLESGP